MGVPTGTDPMIRGMAFSPDGTELAAYVFCVRRDALNLGEAMMVWDLRTGRLVYQRVLDSGGRGQPSGVPPQPLQWFPDGRGWLLYQRYVVDREAAAVVQFLEAAGDFFAFHATRLLDDRRVLLPSSGDILIPTEVRRFKNE